MKRLHIHIGVQKLDESMRFYNALFGTEPIKTKPDYAKWALDSPSVNFAISTRASQQGVDHLGIQIDEEHELTEMRDRLSKTDIAAFNEGETVCCYARLEKTWVQDPSGLPWEAYRTMEDAEVFSERTGNPDGSCGTPEKREQSNRCEPSKETVGCCGR